MYRFVCLFFLLISTTAAAQTPIPRAGDSCPTQTYHSGSYCIPYKSSSTSEPKIIQKQGKDCLIGFYSVGAYCKQLSGSDREAIPREHGGSCPTGWYKSGEYCVRQ